MMSICGQQTGVVQLNVMTLMTLRQYCLATNYTLKRRACSDSDCGEYRWKKLREHATTHLKETNERRASLVETCVTVLQVKSQGTSSAQVAQQVVLKIIVASRVGSRSCIKSTPVANETNQPLVQSLSTSNVTIRCVPLARLLFHELIES